MEGNRPRNGGLPGLAVRDAVAGTGEAPSDTAGLEDSGRRQKPSQEGSF